MGKLKNIDRMASFFRRSSTRWITRLSGILIVVLMQLNAEDLKQVLEPFEPANGEMLISYHPHFQWRGPEMTLDYQPECEIQIAREPNFEKLEATDMIGGGMNRF